MLLFFGDDSQGQCEEMWTDISGMQVKMKNSSPSRLTLKFCCFIVGPQFNNSHLTDCQQLLMSRLGFDTVLLWLLNPESIAYFHHHQPFYLSTFNFFLCFCFACLMSSIHSTICPWVCRVVMSSIPVYYCRKSMWLKWMQTNLILFS